MTLDDLRENLKTAYKAYVEHRAKQNPPKGSRLTNMREAYTFSKKVLHGSPNITPNYRIVVNNLVRAGDIYYHAKKHGLQSAILLKLSMD